MGNTYVSQLQTYAGRDKIMRTSGYVAMMLSGSVQSQSVSKMLQTFSRQISGARVILRLFDDIPMWRTTKMWGADDTDMFARICSILNCISNQMYFPVEHCAWLCDQNILSGDSSKWWIMCTVIWGLSLLLNILKSVRKLQLLKRNREQIRRQRQLESPDQSEQAEAAYRNAMKESAKQQTMEGWNLLKNLADFMMAVNNLPWRPFLWAGKFQPSRNAAFGTISSFVGLYILIEAQKKAKQK